MVKAINKADFLADLQGKIQAHCDVVTAVFQPLTLEQLQWQPAPKEWSILQCFDHLNLTHAYYTPKIKKGLAEPHPVNTTNDIYKPSLWGRIYMHFAFNPKYSFPTADEITPQAAVDSAVLATYLRKQAAYIDFLEQIDNIDLCQTRIPIATAVHFNLGDCLNILAYHDELHINQAKRVQAEQETS